VNVIVRSLTDDLASLVKQIDAHISKNSSKKMKAYVVLLADDPDRAEVELIAFAKKHGITNIPLGVFDGVAGPRAYHIAKDADVTLHMWLRVEVKVNHAFSKGQLNKDAIACVVADFAKILADERAPP
jgi:hypothetical protein